jgi:hypothetical protein
MTNRIRLVFQILVNSSLPSPVLKNPVDVEVLVCVVENEFVTLEGVGLVLV